MTAQLNNQNNEKGRLMIEPTFDCNKITEEPDSLES